ncbi:MAG: ABC transporter permease, partial [Gammaproteobacteria bacterium]|nr:ABC transporter permease [Gammaproteobacteria bacterium]
MSATQAAPKRAPRTPLLRQPRVQRVALPLMVGVVLVALWQWVVVAMELPPYLVP